MRPAIANNLSISFVVPFCFWSPFLWFLYNNTNDLVMELSIFDKFHKLPCESKICKRLGIKAMSMTIVYGYDIDDRSNTSINAYCY